MYCIPLHTAYFVKKKFFGDAETVCVVFNNNNNNNNNNMHYTQHCENNANR